MARQIVVEIAGDASRFNAATQSATQHASGFHKVVMNAIGVAGGILIADAGRQVLDFIKQSFDAEMAAQQIAHQTETVLKSTGNAAHVTAAHVTDLANQIELYSGQSNDAVQNSENLLLTFTSIRNQAGKNNDIFDQSTKIVSDMSVALGQDLKSSAIQVGKALNDPAVGMTALQRIGVSFTQQQKDQIKTLEKHHNLLGAQKIILGELTREFGGSAKAAGQTFAGQIKISQERLQDAGKEIIGKLMPTIAQLAHLLAQFANWLATVGVPALERFFDFLVQHQDVFKAIAAGVAVAAAVYIGTLVPGLIASIPVWWGVAAGVIAATWPFVAIGLVVAALAYAWEHNMFGIRDKTKTAVDFIVAAWKSVSGTLKVVVNDIIGAINTVIGWYNKLPAHFGGPSHLPTIPYLHQGGIVPGSPGQDVLAVLQAGETVLPAGATVVRPTTGSFHVHVHVDRGAFIDGHGIDMLTNNILRRARYAPGF